MHRKRYSLYALIRAVEYPLFMELVERLKETARVADVESLPFDE
jgi:hypothetical protein